MKTTEQKQSRLQQTVRRASLALLPALLLSLSACGFHLRGSYEVPDFLKAVTLKVPTNSQALGAELELALERNRVSADGGDILLEVTSERLNRQTSSVDKSARAAEYILIYTVHFRVGSTDGKIVGPLQSLILRRSYQYSTNNVVGKTTEEETLVNELRQDAAQQIVRQLTALKTSPLDAPATAPAETPQ